MLGFMLILGFPIVTASGYGVVFTLSHLLFRDKKVLNRWNFLLYLLFLAIPFTFALLTAFEKHIFTNVGFRLPQVLGLSLLTSPILASVIGVIIGILLFYNELYCSNFLHRLAWRFPFLHYFIKGKDEKALYHLRGSLLGLFLVTSAFVAFVEEFLWRGYLLNYLGQNLSVPLVISLFISAISFGLNHYYFGLRNILFKTLAGLIWGGLYWFTSSLAIPVLSHFVFNCCAILLQSYSLPISLRRI